MIPLLQNPVQNSHATMITLFMNVVDESLTDDDRMQGLTLYSRATRDLLKYLFLKGALNSRYDPAIIKFNVGRDLVTTYDHVFDR